MMKSIQKNENTVYFSWKRNAVKTRWVYISTIKRSSYQYILQSWHELERCKLQSHRLCTCLQRWLNDKCLLSSMNISYNVTSDVSNTIFRDKLCFE